jgi:hypothetical protein
VSLLFFHYNPGETFPLYLGSVMVVPTALSDAVSENKQLEVAKAVFQSPLPAIINYAGAIGQCPHPSIVVLACVRV